MNAEEQKRAWEIVSELIHQRRALGRQPVEELTELGSAALPALEELLEIGDDDQRQGAVQALAGMRDPSALPAIMRLLGKRPAFAEDLRPLLVRAVGRLAGSDDRDKLRPAVSSFLRDKSALVRAAACDVIAQLKDKELLPSVRPLLDDPHRFARDRAHACLRQLRDEHEPAEVPGVASTQAEAQAAGAPPQPRELRAGVSSSVTRAAEQRSEAGYGSDPFHQLVAAAPQNRSALLTQLLANDEHRARLLRSMRSAPLALRLVILEALPEGELPSDILAVLRERGPRPDLDAAERTLIAQRLLRQDPYMPDRAEMLLALINQPDPRLRYEALSWAALSADRRVIRAWTAALESGDPLSELGAMRGWFGALDKSAHRLAPAGIEALQRLIKSSQDAEERRLALVTGLLTLERLAQAGHWLDGRASIIAAQALASPDHRIRRVACKAILALRSHGGLPLDAAAYAPIEAMLASEDHAERRLALDMLEGSHPATIQRNLGPLLRSLYIVDESELVRICEALARVRHLPDAHFALQRLSHHPNWHVRDAAANALKV